MKPHLSFVILAALVSTTVVLTQAQPTTVETAFCSALSHLAASPATSSANFNSPLTCSSSLCRTISCSTEIQSLPIELQVHFSICSQPPSVDVHIMELAGGVVLLTDRVEQTMIVRGTLVLADVTFETSQDSVLFGLTVSSQFLNTTIFLPTILPAHCQRNFSGSNFPCSPPPPPSAPPLSVHKLTPSDVSVVGALGDTYSTGLRTLARDFFELPYEDRGLSWSGGGFSSLEYVNTLPNILKQFNPSLTGFATDSVNPINQQDQSLLVAVSGATTFNLLQQAETLVERVANNPNISMDEDWKLITIFIGLTDLCHYSCLETNNTEILSTTMTENIQSVLDYLQQNLPRTFVNLVTPADITVVRAYTQVLPACRLVYDMNCPCAFANDSLTALRRVRETTAQLHHKMRVVLESGRYDVAEDFTVEIQPFLEDFEPTLDENGRIDISMLAVDCMHLSTRGQKAYATALWRSMLSPEGDKPTTIDVGDTLACPSNQFPYFYTRVNSAGCPQLCSHDYCSKKATRRAMCRLPGAVNSGCKGQCPVTSCRACYYSSVERRPPNTCSPCDHNTLLIFDEISPLQSESADDGGGVRMRKCFRQWVTCVRRANGFLYGKPGRSYRNQDYFKCFQHPCP